MSATPGSHKEKQNAKIPKPPAKHTENSDVFFPFTTNDNNNNSYNSNHGKKQNIDKKESTNQKQLPGNKAAENNTKRTNQKESRQKPTNGNEDKKKTMAMERSNSNSNSNSVQEKSITSVQREETKKEDVLKGREVVTHRIY